MFSVRLYQSTVINQRPAGCWASELPTAYWWWGNKTTELFTVKLHKLASWTALCPIDSYATNHGPTCPDCRPWAHCDIAVQWRLQWSPQQREKAGRWCNASRHVSAHHEMLCPTMTMHNTTMHGDGRPLICHRTREGGQWEALRLCPPPPRRQSRLLTAAPSPGVWASVCHSV